jgi:hypothetical protein
VPGIDALDGHAGPVRCPCRVDGHADAPAHASRMVPTVSAGASSGVR